MCSSDKFTKNTTRVSQVFMMSREQVSISELLLSLDSSELQEAEQVRALVNQQLSTGEFTCRVFE